MGLLWLCKHLLPLLLVVGLLLVKVKCSCVNDSACTSISVQTTTTQINITFLAAGFSLQNITYLNGTLAYNSSNALMSLKSGTQYIINYGNSSISCCNTTTTRPYPVSNLAFGNVTSNSVQLTWSKPTEYKSDYNYSIQTNTTPAVFTTVKDEFATVTNLTAGVTYTFTVFTKAVDGTEADPVSVTTCTVPGLIPPQNISVSNKNSTSFLEVKWTKPPGNVDYYNVFLNGAVNKITTTIDKQVNVTNLLPGSEYSISIEVVSGNCSQKSSPVTEATYPSQPGVLNFTNIVTNNITLSWGNPINMTSVTKTFNISYTTSSVTWTITSNTSTVTLQSLISGTNYAITVVTVGARKYQSSPVSGNVTTKPYSVSNLTVVNTTSDSVSLTWNKPVEYKSNYSYKVESNSTPGVSTTVTNESITISNLTAGVTYTFTVFTRAYDGTEAAPVSKTTCTVPGLIPPQNISVSNKNSTSFLEVQWTKPPGNVDYYNVFLNGAVNNTTKTNNAQVNFTNLLPGSEYSISIEVVSGNCSQKSGSVTEATYPSQPGALNFTNIATNNITLSWGDPINMTSVTKTFNISYTNSSVTWTITSNTSPVTLQSLISGTNYAITVVTVGARKYQSSPVSGNVTTKPYSVSNLTVINTTSDSVSLTWNKPVEYKSNYSYRVETNSTPGVSATVTNESIRISNLTAGVTYTFTVFTRAYDGTEAAPVSSTTCTVPGLIPPQNISVSNKNSTSFLEVQWTKPPGNVDYYNVFLNGAVINTTKTNNTQVNVTNLLPGSEYSISIEVVSKNCSQKSGSVTEATYPSQPGALNFINIATNNITLSWGDPINMTSVTKTFNISYTNSSVTWTITSNTSTVTLQSLISGTNYAITVVTVGARKYQSSPVSGNVTTKPYSVSNLTVVNTTSDSVSLTWNKPVEYKSNYSYRVETNSTPGVSATVTNESIRISNLTAGVTYTFTVFTRAYDGTEAAPVSTTTCTVPGLIPPQNISVSNKNSISFLEVQWTKPPGNVDYYNVFLNGAVNNTTKTNNTQVNVTNLLPGSEYSISIEVVSGNCSQKSGSVTEATYPSQPGALTFTNIATNNIILSWGDPINMTSVTKSFNISYTNSSVTWTITSNTSPVTLQSLISGTKYAITVVTVGARKYQSSPVSGNVTTKPYSVSNLTVVNTTSDSVSLTWNKPVEYKSNYSYRVETNSTPGVSTTVTNESIRISNLTAGVTYTFTVFTRAYDGTEAAPVSTTTCTLPGLIPPQNISVSNKNSISFLEVKWPKPPGNVDYYNVFLNGAVNNTTKTNDTQVNFTNLLPGSEYSISIEVVSKNCSQKSSPVTEATYPSQPGALNFTNIAANNITLSWGDPINMTSVTKSFNISYTNSSVTWTITSNTSTVTLQSLISGTNYAITVVTVGARQYQSSPVSGNVTTKPYSVSNLKVVETTSDSISLTWNKPVEYKSIYTYRVQTNSTPVVSITVTNESITITNLTTGVTYTFTVFTRAYDGTEADPVFTTCTNPGLILPQNITVSNKNSISFLEVQWTKPPGNVDYYNVFLNGAVNNPIKTNDTQVNFTNLLPGSEYSISIEVVSGNCNQLSGPVSEATYPSQPGALTFTNIATNNITLFWGDPINMTSVTKSFNISYTNSSLTWNIISNTSTVTLQNLISGTYYAITVVTIGARQYQSSPVSGNVTTKPYSVSNLTVINTTSDSVSLTWNKPVEYKSNYSYRVETNSTPGVSITVTNESITISNLTAGVTYTFTVFTRAYDGTEAAPVSTTTCTRPYAVNNLRVVAILSHSVTLNWDKPAEYKNHYTYRVQTNTSTKIWNIIVTSESVTITALTSGEVYTFTVFTRAYNETESDPMSVADCTIPESVPLFECSSVYLKPVLSVTWKCPSGLHSSFTLTTTNSTTKINVTKVISKCNSGIQTFTIEKIRYFTTYTVSITTNSCDKESAAVQKTCLTSIAPLPIITESPVLSTSASSHDKIDFTFLEFSSSNGPIKAYAVILTTDNGNYATSAVLSNTYDDFKNKRTTSYVTYIKESVVQSGRSIINKRNTINVQIGDGSKSHAYYNGPLQPSTSYWISIAGFTAIEYNNETGLIKIESSLVTFAPYSQKVQTPANTGVIVGAVVGSILGSAAIGIIGYFIWRKTRKTERNPDLSFTKIEKSHPLPTASFEAHFRKQQAGSNLGFSVEYASFASVGSTQTTTAAKIPENQPKNRSYNVLPYDISRVTLSIQNHPTDDYINANYIPGFSSKTEFIAAQGPLPSTVNDFWRMIWEKKICAIVMLTKCREAGKVNCEEYWPTDHVKIYGNLTVTLTTVNDFSNWTIREFKAVNNKTEETLKVRHFHFTAWPDHGVPNTTDVLMTFRNAVCEYVNFCSLNSPILVHCSAGVGRTGTLIALDRIMRQIEAEDIVDVFGVVYDLRMHRVLMVQTELQYVFLNQCALDFIKTRRQSQSEPIYQDPEAMGVYEKALPFELKTDV